MSSDGRGESIFFLSTVNDKKIRSTSDTVYLKHIVPQWNQLQRNPGWQDTGITCITDHNPTGSLSLLYPVYEVFFQNQEVI